jgi:hypothetical protein
VKLQQAASGFHGSIIIRASATHNSNHPSAQFGRLDVSCSSTAAHAMAGCIVLQLQASKPTACCSRLLQL